VSTSFNFPANPTLNQVVVLPDGNSAQWNGYAWVSVGDNVTYPLAVPKGGTGATNPYTAKRNLEVPIWTLDDTMPVAPVYGDRWIRPGSMTEVVWLPNAGGTGVWVNLADVGSVAYPIPISKGGTGATDAAGARTALGITPVNIGALPIDGTGTMIAPLKLADGVVATPALVWNSEPGLGFYRPGASQIGIAAQGVRVAYLAANLPESTALYINPRGVSGAAILALYNQPPNAPNYNSSALVTTAAGYTNLVNSAAGSSAVMPVLIQGEGVIVTPTSGAQAQNELRLAANNVANNQNSILGMVGGTTYWRMDLGDTTAASGTSTGKDFRVLRFNNSGVLIDIPFVLQRATGDVYIANTGSNLVIPGGRIAFPSTQSPSTLANVLDDYREYDSFTLTNGAGVPMTILSSKVVKVGRIVTMWCQCSFGASSSQGSVTLTILGLPSIFAGYGSLTVGYPGMTGNNVSAQLNGFDINVYVGNAFATFAQMSGVQFYFGGSYLASN
jgi:hypothetical protein